MKFQINHLTHAVQGCDAKISINHLNKHLVCPCVRSFPSNEIVHLYPLDEDSELKSHFKDHEICMGSQVCCLTCKMEIGDQVGNVSVGSLLNHAGLHEMDQHEIPK